MKNTIRYLIRIVLVNALVLLIITGCGGSKPDRQVNYSIKDVNGVKVFNNNGTPSVDSVSMIMTEKYILQGNVEDENEKFQIRQPIVHIDEKGDLYIVDLNSSSLKKFDGNGNFVAQLGNKGTGPGEFYMPMSVITANDTIYGFDATLKVNKYDCSNEFVSALNIPQSEGIPVMLRKSGDKFVGYRVSSEQKEGKLFLVFDLMVMDSKFKKIRTITKNKVEFDPSKPLNPMDLITFYAVKDNEIAVADKTPDRFRIKVYDLDGNNIYDITKNFRKVKYSEREIEEANRMLAEAMQNIPGQPKQELDGKYKDAVSGMWYDKYGRLWVGTATEDDGSQDFEKKLPLDVFNNGIFLNSYIFKRNNRMVPVDFVEDNIVMIDMQENTVAVFDY